MKLCELFLFGLWSALHAQSDTVLDNFTARELVGWQGLKDCWQQQTVDGQSFLELGGPSDSEIAAARLTYITKGQDWNNYQVGVTVQKHKGAWAGLFLRRSSEGFYEVSIADNGGVMVRAHPGARVLARTVGQLNDGKPHRLDVTAVGPFLRIYVDDALHTVLSDRGSTHGTAGLFGHLAHARFSRYLQTRKVPAEQGVFAVPSEAAEAWVFQPDSPVALPLDVWNGTEAERDITLTVFDEAKPNTPIATVTVSVPPGMKATSLSIPPKKEGLHFVRVRLDTGSLSRDMGKMPMGVWNTPPPDETISEPFFPVGVYDKYNLGGDGTFKRTYLHAICRDLRKNGLNTLLTGGVIRTPTVQQLDICWSYGVRVVLRIDSPADEAVMTHPAVISCMLGDEPKLEEIERYKKRYEDVNTKYPDLFVATCLVGESAGSDAPNNPLRIWWALQPKVRLVRYYPYRKNNYGLLNPITYKKMMPFDSAMKAFGISFDTPWWYVAQTFGGNVTPDSTDPYWRNPTPPEMSAMLHTALAYGATGILCYSYQSESDKRPALVAQDGLVPNDDKYKAVSAIARQVAKHKTLLSVLKFGGVDARSSRFEIMVVPVQTEQEKFIYLVNRDPKHSIRTRLQLADLEAKSAVEIYSGSQTRVSTDKPYRTFTTKLKPGEGQLWKIEN